MSISGWACAPGRSVPTKVVDAATVLGVANPVDGFTEAQVRKAWLHKAATLHPDRGGDAEQFIAAKDAKDVVNEACSGTETVESAFAPIAVFLHYLGAVLHKNTLASAAELSDMLDDCDIPRTANKAKNAAEACFEIDSAAKNDGEVRTVVGPSTWETAAGWMRYANADGVNSVGLDAHGYDLEGYDQSGYHRDTKLDRLNKDRRGYTWEWNGEAWEELGNAHGVKRNVIDTFRKYITDHGYKLPSEHDGTQWVHPKDKSLSLQRMVDPTYHLKPVEENVKYPEKPPVATSYREGTNIEGYDGSGRDAFGLDYVKRDKSGLHVKSGLTFNEQDARGYTLVYVNSSDKYRMMNADHITEDGYMLMNAGTNKNKRWKLIKIPGYESFMDAEHARRVEQISSEAKRAFERVHTDYNRMSAMERLERRRKHLGIPADEMPRYEALRAARILKTTDFGAMSELAIGAACAAANALKQRLTADAIDVSGASGTLTLTETWVERECTAVLNDEAMRGVFEVADMSAIILEYIAALSTMAYVIYKTREYWMPKLIAAIELTVAVSYAHRKAKHERDKKGLIMLGVGLNALYSKPSLGMQDPSKPLKKDVPHNSSTKRLTRQLK